MKETNICTKRPELLVLEVVIMTLVLLENQLMRKREY